MKHLGKKVHVLENNEGLLERDFATYAPFYASFGLSCAKSIDGTSDICYCLKRENNAYFNAAILRGQLELGDTVLIVDEVPSAPHGFSWLRGEIRRPRTVLQGRAKVITTNWRALA